MISFYPGPSKLYPEIPSYMKDATKEGILSINHRSKEFVKISEKTIKLLKKKLRIPEDYWIFYTSSATESWEIIAQSLITHKSLHVYNGAFGEKWFEYTQKLVPDAEGIKFNSNETFPFTQCKSRVEVEVIGIVQNETSNGSQISNKNILTLKELNPNALIAVDATSSIAGVKLDIQNADVWLASVQKCFGLPAGMGLLICSPKAIEKALKINNKDHYNSLSFMIDKMKDWQTTYTPNVLSIYLLMRIMENVPSVSATDKLIKNRAKEWYQFFSTFKSVKLLIQEKSLRSDTVIAVEADDQIIAKIKEKAKSKGFLLGNGYGQWAKNTFRIANFPAISGKEITSLKKFFRKNIQ